MRRNTGVELATAAVLTALLGSTLTSTLAQADDRTPAPPARTVSAGAIPAVVDPAADLAAKTPGAEDEWADSIYFTSRVNADGHDVGLLVHTVRLPDGPGNLLLVSATTRPPAGTRATPPGSTRATTPGARRASTSGRPA